MTYEEKQLIAENAINNRLKLKTVRIVPFIFIFNQILIIALLITALLIGTDNYAVYLVIPAIVFFTVLFFKKQKISVICSSIIITASVPIFIVSAYSTCKKNQSKPLNDPVTVIAEEVIGDTGEMLKAKKARRDMSEKSTRNTADLIYIVTAAESILIALLTCKSINAHEKLRQLDGYPLFEVNFDTEVDSKVNEITEERIRRKENIDNEQIW